MKNVKNYKIIAQRRELTAENDMELYEAVRAFKSIAEELEKATEGLR